MCTDSEAYVTEICTSDTTIIHIQLILHNGHYVTIKQMKI